MTETPQFTIEDDGKSIACHKCGATSHNQHDIEQRYCGSCHQYLDTELTKNEILSARTYTILKPVGDTYEVELTDMITSGKWVKEHPELMRVGHDCVSHLWEVSTVLLPFDHGFDRIPGMPQSPLYFETMIFLVGEGDHESEFNEQQWRYATYEEAKAGHANVVKYVQDACSRD